MSAFTGSSPEPSRRPGHRGKVAAFGLVALATGLLSAAPSAAATAPTLATAGSFAVLASSTVTNTGPSVINGDLGVSPGDAVTGFQESDGGPGLVNGTLHAGDAVAEQAQADASTAYTSLASQACPVENDLTGDDLVGLTLTAGVYCFSSSAQLSGALTLDAEGDPDAVFVFQIGSTLTTASDSSVVVTNSEAACNVFWQVGSAATLGTGTDFVGTILAGSEAITAATGATVMGRLVSLSAAVTFDSNVVSADSCTDAGTTDGTTDGATTDGTTTDDSTDSSARAVPPTGTATTGGDDAGRGRDDAGTGRRNTDGGITRTDLPATGANAALLGVALAGGLAIAVGATLRHLSTRARAAAPTPRRTTSRC